MEMRAPFIPGLRPIVVASCLTAVAGQAAAQQLPVTDGLRVRLDASTLGLADDAEVTAWPDTATADGAQDATTVASRTPPVFRASDDLGRPAVRFSADSGLAYGGGFDFSDLPGQEAFTLIVLADQNDNQASPIERAFQFGDVPGVGTDGGAEGAVVSLDINAGNMGGRYNNGNTLAGGFGLGDPSIGALRGEAGDTFGTIDVYLDGEFLPTTSTNPDNQLLLREDGYTVGYGSNAASAIVDGLEGRIFEVLYYNRALTDEELESVSEYLEEKWKLVPRPADIDGDFDVDVQDLLGYLRLFRGAKSLAPPQGQFVSSGLSVRLDASRVAELGDINGFGEVVEWPDTATGDGAQNAMWPVLPVDPPEYVADDGEGRSVVRFSGNDALTYESGLGFSGEPGQDPFTIVVAGSANNTFNVRPFQIGDLPTIGSADGAGGASATLDIRHNLIGGRYNDGNTLADDTGKNAGDPLVAALRHEIGDTYAGLDVAVDGEFLATTAGGGANQLTLADDGYSVGMGAIFDGTPGDFLDGDLYEILFYQRALSDQELQDVSNFLFHKWDLPVDYGKADVDGDGDVDVQDLLGYLRAFRAK